MSGDFPVEEMSWDLHFQAFPSSAESGVYSREVVTYEEEWVDGGSSSPEAEDPDPVFEDASCRVQQRPSRGLPIGGLLLVVAVLLWRRAGRRDHPC